MSYLSKVKDIVRLNAPDDLLISIVIEMGRFFDKQYTLEIQNIQKRYGVILDTPTRNLLRKKYYYGKYCTEQSPYPIAQCTPRKADIEAAFEDCYNRLKAYDPEKIVSSMESRINDLQNQLEANRYMDSWLKQFDERRSNKRYSFLSIRIDQDFFVSNEFDENIITDFIRKTYDSLENYRYLAIVVQGEIFNERNECITWNLLYKAGVFAENFIQYKKRFPPFNDQKQIAHLISFLDSRGVKNSALIAKDFYSSISTGYKFEDCYISESQTWKILIYKKIQLDDSHIPCPACNTIIQSGNSYPEVFLKSWECKNPSCPARSKSGRGKRFDEYGTYRYFKLVENAFSNQIDPGLYQSFRRDVFLDSSDWIEFLIKEYTYGDEKIYMYNTNIPDSFNRICINLDYNTLSSQLESITTYEELPIVKLYKSVLENSKLRTGKKKLRDSVSIINADSTEFLQTLVPGQIGTVITSPPYYNAREYSQWSTMIMYLADMLLNCKAVYNSLADGAYYLYNIGDIVSEDNIYVMSNMSKRRVQLGFLSCMIFEIAGYTLTGNLIWDKGEVQSKRNSTVNLFSGYVKCINCYEHVLVFRKGAFERISNAVEQITPVIKINSKGENTYKHTAPYPIELVALIEPYLNKNLYLLDPFLGSGTTLLWCKQHNQRGVGTELNSSYYELCLSKLSD